MDIGPKMRDRNANAKTLCEFIRAALETLFEESSLFSCSSAVVTVNLLVSSNEIENRRVGNLDFTIGALAVTVACELPAVPLTDV